MLCFCEMYFVFGFLCELSHQQRNNINGLAARYKIFGVNAQKEIIRFYIFLLIQIQNTCRCRIQWECSLNCMTSSIVTTLPEDYLLFIYLCFYAVFVFLWPLYHSDGDILLVLLRQRLILAVSPIFSFTSVSPILLMLFRPGSFRTRSCSSWVISDHCRNLSSCCFSQQ